MQVKAIVISVNGKERKLPVPSSLDKLTAKQGIMLASTLKDREEIKEGNGKAFAENTMTYLQHLTGCGEEDIKLIPTDTAAAIMETVEAFWRYEPKERKYFEIDGTKYHFPRADTNPLDSTTLGEFVDSMDARQNFDKMAGGEWEAMLRCCAIYCRPAVDSEEGLKLEPFTEAGFYKRLELFERELSMQDLIDFGFFLNKQIQLSLAVLPSLLTDAAQRLDDLLEGDTDGSEQSMN